MRNSLLDLSKIVIVYKKQLKNDSGDPKTIKRSFSRPRGGPKLGFGPKKGSKNRIGRSFSGFGGHFSPKNDEKVRSGPPPPDLEEFDKLRGTLTFLIGLKFVKLRDPVATRF